METEIENLVDVQRLVRLIAAHWSKSCDTCKFQEGPQVVAHAWDALRF